MSLHECSTDGLEGLLQNQNAAVYRMQPGLLITDEEVGPIMCGGFSAYVACKWGAVKPGQWIVVIGRGGGIGHFAVQHTKVMGIRIIAID